MADGTEQGTAACAPAAVDVLYIGGMPRSGSTLTDLMLDTLPGHVAVGELFYLWRDGLKNDGLCACGAVFSACPFWHAVGQEAFGGWSTIDAEHVLRLQQQVDRTACIPQVLARRPPAFAAALDEYSALLQRLYDAIASVAGAQVVVDSSKRPSLAFVLRSMPRVRLTVAHVVRDPRGVAFSFSKRVELPAGATSEGQMPRSRTRKVARRWVTVNALVASLSRLGVPLVRVRYEDLVRDPLHELGRVAAAEGRASQVDRTVITEGGLRVPQTHVVAGGRIRLTGGVMPLRLDDAWRRDMAPGARRVVSAVTAATRARYGYR